MLSRGNTQKRRPQDTGICQNLGGLRTFTGNGLGELSHLTQILRPRETLATEVQAAVLREVSFFSLLIF